MMSATTALIRSNEKLRSRSSVLVALTTDGSRASRSAYAMFWSAVPFSVAITALRVTAVDTPNVFLYRLSVTYTFEPMRFRVTAETFTSP